MEKVYTLPEHGDSLCAAVLAGNHSAALAGPEQRQGLGLGLTGKTSKYPHFRQTDKGPSGFLYCSIIHHSHCKLKAPATQTVFKTSSPFIFVEDLSIWLEAMLQIPRSAWWETASMLNRKEKPTPWCARRWPSMPWACFFSFMVHTSTKIPGGENCSASLTYTIKLVKSCLSVMLL